MDFSAELAKMDSSMKSLLRVLAFLAPAACLPQSPIPASTIRIDASRPRIAVSRSLYGIFFEEINQPAKADSMPRWF